LPVTTIKLWVVRSGLIAGFTKVLRPKETGRGVVHKRKKSNRMPDVCGRCGLRKVARQGSELFSEPTRPFIEKLEEAAGGRRMVAKEGTNHAEVEVERRVPERTKTAEDIGGDYCVNTNKGEKKADEAQADVWRPAQPQE